MTHHSPALPLWASLQTTPYQRHSATSKAAARQLRPNTDRVAVFTLLKANPAGLTDEQIIDGTGLSPSTARPRRIDLVNSGVVIDSGMTRPTRSGRAAVVWKVKA